MPSVRVVLWFCLLEFLIVCCSLEQTGTRTEGSEKNERVFFIVKQNEYIKHTKTKQKHRLLYFLIVFLLLTFFAELFVFQQQQTEMFAFFSQQTVQL